MKVETKFNIPLILEDDNEEIASPEKIMVSACCQVDKGSTCSSPLPRRESQFEDYDESINVSGLSPLKTISGGRQNEFKLYDNAF